MEAHVQKLFHYSSTMFVYLRGHRLLEYYFSVADARIAANDMRNERLGQ
jgi:hypothetical protein